MWSFTLIECHVNGSELVGVLLYSKPRCACRYDSILLSILELKPFREEIPAALLEHVVTEGTGSPGAPGQQARLFKREPGSCVETIDLLMCAASTGSVRITQALLDCGILPLGPTV